MSKKIKIQETIVAWSSYELDGKLEEVVAKLQGLMKSNPNHFDFNIDVESESGYYGSCSTNINITAYRWETDAEFEERIAAAKKAAELSKIRAKQQAQSQERRERTLYESLKKKFEKEIDETNTKN